MTTEVNLRLCINYHPKYGKDRHIIMNIIRVLTALHQNRWALLGGKDLPPGVPTHMRKQTLRHQTEPSISIGTIQSIGNLCS
jgi:hypothetical protein